MNKRIVSVLMVLALVFANFCFTGNIKALDCIRVYATETNCNVGNRVTIPIRIENNTGLMGFAFSVSYDSKKLSPVSVSSGEVINTGILNDSIETSSTNSFEVHWSASESVSTDGVIFYVSFDVLENVSGDSSIELSNIQTDTYDDKYHKVTIAPENILIHITGSSSIPTTEQITTTGKKEGDAAVQSSNISLENNVLSVPIFISNNNGLRGYNLEIQYDSSIIVPISVTNNGNFSGSFDHNIGIFENKFNVLWTGSNNIFADGELFTVEFNLIKPSISKTDIKLSYNQEDTFKDKNTDVVLNCKDVIINVDELMGRVATTTKQKNESTTKKKETDNKSIKSFKKKKAKIKRIKLKKKRSVKITIKKIKGSNGYQIKYSTNKKFKKSKKKTCKKPIKTIKKLKKEKYFFRVRAFKYFGKTKVYTKWSKRKSIRIGK